MGGRAGIAKVRVKFLDKSFVLRLVFCTAAANAAAINLMYLQTASLVSSRCQGRSKKEETFGRRPGPGGAPADTRPSERRKVGRRHF